MENASRALIMAAGVLVGIMILTIAVYLFATFGAASAEVHSQKNADRINEFNTQFTTYEGKSNTIYDVITAANIATENNINYELPKVSSIITAEAKNTYVQVNLKNTNHNPSVCIEGASNYSYDYENLIKEELNTIAGSNTDLNKYSCKVYISTITKMVYRVDFNMI